MYSIGIDIGTTNISLILVDIETRQILHQVHSANTSAACKDATSSFPFGANTQDPTFIWQTVQQLLGEIFLFVSLEPSMKPIVSIGLTGQMHGILYVDKTGEAVTPLFTWQNQLGHLPYHSQQSYLEWMSLQSQEYLATGFGLVTHFVLQEQNLLPPDAEKFCTIMDFIGMKLAQQSQPLCHSTTSASLGFFNLKTHSFKKEKLLKLGISLSFLPATTPTMDSLGSLDWKIFDSRLPEKCLSLAPPTISIAIGDNQASFLGSMKDTNGILINVGTGSQISFLLSQPALPLETRPFFEPFYLGVGSALCGGYAYQLLADFFMQVQKSFSPSSLPPLHKEDLYKKMNLLATSALEKAEKAPTNSPFSPLQMQTQFQGTRVQPDQTATISKLTKHNFTPADFCLATLDGICQELWDFYQPFLHQKEASFTHLVGSGNGIRKNPLLQRLFQEKFKLPLYIPCCEEEACYGAALSSLLALKQGYTLQNIQSFITYL